MNKKTLIGILAIVAVTVLVLISQETQPDYEFPQIDEDIAKINTVGWQDFVFISPDGNELYFAYMPYAQNIVMDKYFGKISEEDVKRRGPLGQETTET